MGAVFQINILTKISAIYMLDKKEGIKSILLWSQYWEIFSKAICYTVMI